MAAPFTRSARGRRRRVVDGLRPWRRAYMNQLKAQSFESNRVEHVLPGHADVLGAAASPAFAREQRMRALGQANQIRIERARLKSELATGHARIEDVLTHPPTFAATAKVSELLLAVPGIGPVRATRALTRCQIPHQKTTAGLSERQRVALIVLLRTGKPGFLTSNPS